MYSSLNFSNSTSLKREVLVITEMRSKCRLWWPKGLLSSSLEENEEFNWFLFGWFISCSTTSLDIVVSFKCGQHSLSHSQSNLEEILHETNGNMPKTLQDKSKFCLLGQCSVNSRSNGFLDGREKTKKNRFSFNSNAGPINKNAHKRNTRRQNCGCSQTNRSLEQSRWASQGNDNWIQLMFDSHNYIGGENHRIPAVEHIRWNGAVVYEYDLNVIIYETPSYGAQHFSMCRWTFYERMKNSSKKPTWVYELEKTQPSVDLDTVILAINSAAASNTFFELHLGPSRTSIWCSALLMYSAFTGHLLATIMASLSTLCYIVLQLFHMLFIYGSESWLYIILEKLFATTCSNIKIRGCQILYWPIFLQKNDMRSQSSVEYAEKAAQHKHSVWSILVVDVLLGTMFALLLLLHSELICRFVLHFTNDIINTFLRSGCVWLMGNPAGFKLNTELAGVLGMISLNAIQIWSTLWIFTGLVAKHIILGLAVLGIFCGFTTSAALIIDIIGLATLHVSALHWLISLLYSSQLRALAALWRLFRGRKWNPLRQRLDSFDYNVKQHIVGSLLFTPLLLLLPTTSVFYIFFSIVDTTINLFCIYIEVVISLIHATPYIKIFLRLVGPRRFPSGIWLEVLHCLSKKSDTCHTDGTISSSGKLSQRKDLKGDNSCILISILRSNILSIGEIILPHYKHVFAGVSGPFITATAYGILTGRRMPPRLGTSFPSTMPWMSMPYKEYWWLCHDSIVACFTQ